MQCNSVHCCSRLPLVRPLLLLLPFPVFTDVEFVPLTRIEGARLGITVRRFVCYNVLRLLRGAINGYSHHTFGRKA